MVSSRVQAGSAARQFAGYLVRAAILLVAVNAGLGIFYAIQDHHRAGRRGPNPILQRYPFARPELLKLYPSMTWNEIDDMLWESWGRSLTPYLYTGFGEMPFHGKYVNVTEHGFRQGADQAPWPPARNSDFVVFLFGGSTTFGYGVPDSQALGSQLQPLLAARLKRRVAVYNFGQGCYFSTQERLYFEKLVLAGQRPDLAIFVDGLNDFQAAGKEVACSWEQLPSGAPQPETFGSWVRTGIEMLPMMRLAAAMHTRLQESGHLKPRAKAAAAGPRYDDPAALKQVIETYFANKRIIEAQAREFSVQTLFVWQPVPTYEYDLSHHIFTGERFDWHLYSRFGYPLMRDAVARTHPENFVWCADIQKDLHEELYVDADHYSPKMIGIVANCIAQGAADQHR